jgi:hypothetical protein
MKKLYLLLLLALTLLLSCSTIRFSESDLKWNNSFPSSKLFLINDSVVLGSRGGGNYLIDSSTGKVLDSISEKTVEPFFPKYEEGYRYEEFIDITWRQHHIAKLKTLPCFDYNIIKIRYLRIFRWGKHDHADFVIIRKNDAKKNNKIEKT